MSYCPKPKSTNIHTAISQLKKELAELYVAQQNGTANELTINGEVALDETAVASLCSILSECMPDVNVAGGSFDPSTLVLTLTQDEGGPDITVNLSELSKSYTQDTDTVRFEGDGSQGNPLKATAISNDTSTHYYQINKAGRAYLYADERWISQADDHYGTQYVNFAESGGRGAEPVIEWEVIGEPIRQGTKVHDIILKGRINHTTDIDDIIIAAYFVASDPTALTTTGINSDTAITATEIGRMTYKDGGADDSTITGSMSNLYQRKLSFDFTAPTDGELRLYYKPVNQTTRSGSTRFYRHSMSWLLSYKK